MAVDARKVLASAIANAENNHNLDVDALVVAEASVGKSITMKRFAHARPRQVDPHPEAVQPAAHRRSRAGRSIMGHKSNPIGLRLQINRTWDSRWYRGRRRLWPAAAGGPQDPQVHHRRRCPQAAISKVVIERPAKLCRISIYAARPGVIIGKKGADIEKLRKTLGAMTASDVSAEHRRDPQAGSRCQARRAGHRRSARAPYRLPPRDEARGAVGAASRCRGHPRSPAAAVSAAPKSRASKGIARAGCRCTRCARNIDYAEAEAHTAYGVCGVKVLGLQGRDPGP